VNRVVVMETVLRHFRNLLFAAFAVLLLILGLGSSTLENTLWPAFITLLTIVAGAALIGPEFSSGTLQLILVKPVNRAVYLVSRWTGVVLFIAICASGAFVAEAIGRLIWGGGDQIGKSAITLLNVTSDAAVTCAILALFGTFLRAYFNVALYWLLLVVISLVKSLIGASKMATGGFMGWIRGMALEYPILEKSVDWLNDNLFPEAPGTFDRDWLLMVWSNAFVALVLACLIFRRREVPYGAD
jgi:ABC-type transport system involved in multi-copper enzyme maturation permease subunit